MVKIVLLLSKQKRMWIKAESRALASKRMERATCEHHKGEIRGDECQRSILPFGWGGPRFGHTSKLATFGDGLGIFTGTATSKNTKARPVEDSGITAKPGGAIGSQQGLNQFVEGPKHATCVG